MIGPLRVTLITLMLLGPFIPAAANSNQEDQHDDVWRSYACTEGWLLDSKCSVDVSVSLNGRLKASGEIVSPSGGKLPGKASANALAFNIDRFVIPQTSAAVTIVVDFHVRAAHGGHSGNLFDTAITPAGGISGKLVVGMTHLECTTCDADWIHEIIRVDRGSADPPVQDEHIRAIVPIHNGTQPIPAGVLRLSVGYSGLAWLEGPVLPDDGTVWFDVDVTVSRPILQTH